MSSSTRTEIIAEELAEAIFEARLVTVFKATIVACTTWHFYYTDLHFDEKVEYIWSKKWTLGKAVYLLARYLGTFFLICAIAGVWKYAWMNDRDSLMLREGMGFFRSCFFGELFAGLGPMVILVSEGTLMMRVYALYGRNKKLLTFFILLAIILALFNILQITPLFIEDEVNICLKYYCPRKRVLAWRNLFGVIDSDGFACMVAFPISGIGWAVMAFVELLLFLLVVSKAGNWKRAGSAMRKYNDQLSPTRDITTTMARDSTAYFSVFFSACLIGAVFKFVTDHLPERLFDFTDFEMNLYETIVITTVTILSPNVILNLRATYYGPSEDGETQLSWNVQVPTLSTSSGVLEGPCAREELESFVD